MKKMISLFLSFIFVFGIFANVPVSVNAASVDDLTFELNEDGVSYSVTECNPSAEGEIIIPDTYNGLPVTDIGSEAFWYCKNITKVKLSDNIVNIGKSAFSGCSGLVSVVMSKNLNYISYDAFCNCTKLMEIELPDSVINIEQFAFSNTGYYNNQSNWEDGVLYIGNHLIEAEESLSGAYNVKDGTISIAGSAFYNCKNISDIIIPNTVIGIGNRAFYGCSGITEISLASKIKELGAEVFYNCTSLTSVILPDGLKSIGWYSFDNCKKLKSIIIPDSVESIGVGAFANCEIITKITLSKNVLSIGYNAFYNCSSLEEIEIPKNVTQIAHDTFRWCKNLTKVTIGNEVSSIDDYAFFGCNSLVDVYFLGTKSDWKNLSIGEYNTDLTNATIHFLCEHISTKWVTDKKATVNSAGKKVKKCTECGEILETAKIAQLKAGKPKLKSIENTEYGVLTKWSKVSGADKYDVYRKTGSNGKYTKIGTTSKTYYTDKKASSGKKYYYYVKAVNEAGASSSSNSLSKYYLADTTLSTPKSTKSGITLKWKKITGAEGYMVYRKTGSGSYSKIATVKGNSKVTYTDKKAKKGKTYTYKIKAYKSKTYSAYSNTKKIKDKY